jgi:hypothetical protein
MSSKIVVANGVYDLSKVNNIKSLREEINFLKASIKKDEEELEERLRLLPQQAVKSAADNLLPSFLNKMIANGSWKLLMSGVTMFANPFSKGFSFKKNIVGSAKKLGLMALAKGAYSYFANRKTTKVPGQLPVKKVPAVTTLKTKPPVK